MIIRHAEKPLHGVRDRSVSIDGFHAPHELTVRGWQRAAALVRFFAPLDPRPADHPIAAPKAIFASAATRASPSLRAQRTVLPLSAATGVPVDSRHAEGEEVRIASASLIAAQPVLIAWHHHAIPALARRIAGDGPALPADWPDDRYDMVWVLDRPQPGAPWAFRQVPQLLLPRDLPDAL